ncbi:hypothetical protein NKJ26_03225 [Mesorhizobium sp. M0152]|uniref:hypothetical protein n=1 Tax=Mesorhizobium sp. M0152 TaxID=2956898 RepID=UPI003339BFDB
MTPKQIHDAIDRLKAVVGPAAYISVSLTSDQGFVRGTIYPLGILGSRSAIYAENATTFEECFEQLNAKWAERRTDYHTENIRKMALEIIDLKHHHGVCSAAALRKAFSADEVRFFGPDACALASQMCGGLDFTIADGTAAIAA